MSSSLLLEEIFFVSSRSPDEKDYFPSCQTDHLNARAGGLKGHFPEQPVSAESGESPFFITGQREQKRPGLYLVLCCHRQRLKLVREVLCKDSAPRSCSGGCLVSKSNIYVKHE